MSTNVMKREDMPVGAKPEEEKKREYDELCEPAHVKASRDHPLWSDVLKAIKEIYDPEIPVNIYELGLIYEVDINKKTNDVYVKMSLTSPACPVAQDMPVWVQSAVFGVKGVENVDVEVVWEPEWNPSMMSEAAKLELNMFI